MAVATIVSQRHSMQRTKGDCHPLSLVVPQWNCLEISLARTESYVYSLEKKMK